VLLLVAQGPFFSRDDRWPMRQWMFDLYQRTTPRQTEAVKRVRIIDIDDASLERIGQWPWSRSRLTRLIDVAVAKGAAVVALDILLPEPDRQSPGEFAESYPDLAPELKAQIKALKPSDEIFAEVAGGYGVVVARAGMVEASAGARQTLTWPGVEFEGRNATWALPRLWPGVLPNVPAIEAQVQYAGIVNRYEASDGVVRRVPVVAWVAGNIATSLAMEAIRATNWAESLTLVGDENGVVGAKVAGEFYGTDPDGSILPYFAEDDGANRIARRVSASDLLQDPERFSDSEFKNQMVLIGVTALGLVDAPPTALAGRIDGVELQAQLIENLLSGARLTRPAHMHLVEAVTLAVGVILVVVLLPLLRPLASFAAVLALVAGAVAVGFQQFASARLLFDPTYPAAGALAVYVAMLSSMLAEGLRHRRALNAALERERLDNARLSGELDAAREIQMGILPDTRNIEGLPTNINVFAMLEPAREVGGDLYDVFMLDEHRLFFVVGDVSGKGVPASLFMAISKALCRSVALRVDGSAADKLAVTNDEISRENPALLFVTAVAGVVDARTGILDFCIAGHDAPLLLRAGEAPFELQSAGGPPLCAMDEFPYPTESYQLLPGDTLVLSTDGITEAMNVGGDLYGRPRMMELLGREAPTTLPEELVQVLYEDVARYRGEALPSDDLTVMAIRYSAP
jgi:serine phosphatase RsbU (regulator of sigma subunit)